MNPAPSPTSLLTLRQLRWSQKYPPPRRSLLSSRFQWMSRSRHRQLSRMIRQSIQTGQSLPLFPLPSPTLAPSPSATQ